MKKVEYIKPNTTVYNINLHDGILGSTSTGNITSGTEGEGGDAREMNNDTDAPMANSNTNLWDNEW